MIDIRSHRTVKPVTMHETVTVWGMFPKFSFVEETKGTYLEAVEEWTIAAGARAEAHLHNTHEYYYILEGDAVVQIEKEARQVHPGDLVYIPPNAVNTIWPTGEKGIRAFSFSVSYQEPKGTGYIPAELPEVPVTD